MRTVLVTAQVREETKEEFSEGIVFSIQSLRFLKFNFYDIYK